MSGFMPARVYNGQTEADINPRKPRPEGFEGEEYDCDGCNGNGVYYGAGSVVNGQFVGFTGKCYRCGGKGYQTPADRKRCYVYDTRYRRIPGF